MIDRTMIREGAVVYGVDGEKLGTIRSCDAGGFVIEKGFFFPKDTVARYEDVASVDDDGIRMAYGKEAFSSEGWERRGERAASGPGLKERIQEKLTGGRGEMRAGEEDVRVPISEEELDVSKRDRQAGEVTLKKDVTTEHRTVDVPVTKERVRVERVPVERSATGDEADFQRTTASMPVHEEEIEVHKRPVVKEEVRLRKERQIEHRAADADVRSERVSIEGEGAAGDVTPTRDPHEDER